MKLYLSTLVLVLSLNLANAERFYVAATASEGGDGATWQTAYNYLQDALDQTVAGRGDEVWVSAGTYFPDDGASVTEGDREATFKVKDDVTVYGGFAGTETNVNERDWEANETILSGEIFEGEENKQFWSLHVAVLTRIQDDGNHVIDGLTIQNGTANGTDWLEGRGRDRAGALYGLSEDILGDPNGRIVRNCKFRNNYASGLGGAVFGEFNFYNCTFESNSSGGSGGAVLLDWGTQVIENCSFLNNSSDSGGGAIYKSVGQVSDNLILSGCVFEGNSSLTVGGGIWGEGTITAEGCVFQNNTSQSQGGAIYGTTSFNSPTYLTNCFFVSNSSNTGGVYYGDGVGFTATNCVFLENSAVTGGCSSISRDSKLINCTVISNQASGAANGGAFYVQTSRTLTLINCIMSGNAADGTINHIAGNGQARNYDPDSSPFPLPDPPPDILYPNLIQGGDSYLTISTIDLGSELIEGEPEFVDFFNVIGEDSEFGTADDGLRPAESGNLINAGLNEGLFELGDKDIAGFLRVQGSEIELGAYEYGDLVNFYDLATLILPEGSGSIIQSGNGAYVEGTSATIEAIPSEGFIFGEWQGDATGSTNPYELLFDSDKSVTAVFIPLYDLTTSVSPEGSGSVIKSEEGPYAEGSTVTIEAIPTQDWVFDHWEGDATGSSNPLEVVLDSHITITAIFSGVYNLTTDVFPDDSGSVTESGNGLYVDGTIATLEATPSLGYLFVNWQGDTSSTDNPFDLTMDQNKTITATFAKDHSDNDNDGLTAFDELVTYGTNPESDDTDGDGLLDGEEIGTIFNPTIDDTATFQLLANHPEIYAQVVSPKDSVHPEILITRNENGEFALIIKVQQTNDLNTWTNLDLSNAVVDGDEIRLTIPLDEATEFLRVLGSK